METLNRITQDPAVMGGKACILQALRYAAWRAEEREVALTKA